MKYILTNIFIVDEDYKINKTTKTLTGSVAKGSNSGNCMCWETNMEIFI